MVLPADGSLPLAGGQVGVHILQLLGGDEVHLTLQLAPQAGEGHVQGFRSLTDGTHDGTDAGLQVVDVPVLPGDDLFPVPLIHIDGVDVVYFLVTADGVHISIQTLALMEAVALQRQTFPLGQRVNHLTVQTHIGNIKGHGALHAVQVIVEAGTAIHEQGGGDAAQVQRVAEVCLEGICDKGDGSLQLIVGQGHFVAGWNVKLAHEKINPLR